MSLRQVTDMQVMPDLPEAATGWRAMELAYIDEVTGLPNRRHLLQQLDLALRALARRPGVLTLLAVQVPRVRELATQMGFAVGDELAAVMALRLREHCGPEVLIAHLGGGEYALALRQEAAAAQDSGLQQAQQVQQALQAPVCVQDGIEIFSACRVGVAFGPADAATAAGLLEAARQAARQAQALPGQLCCFRPVSDDAARRELQMEQALRHALARQELSLVYQPQVCLQTGQVLAVEALLRWDTPQWGVVPTTTFIAMAERTGLIAGIGEWVLRQVCLQIVQWRAAGLPAVRVAVNVSPLQFQLGDVALVIRRALQDSGADASSLCLELTERALLHDADRVVATLKALRAQGIAITLDDFGTGASSLRSLRTLPVGLVKIDRSFIADISSEPESASVARAILQLAHGLRIPVLAEGVETEAQLALLVADGCDRMQGNLFSPPLPVQAITELLMSGRRLDSHLAPRAPRQRTLLLVDDEPHILAAMRRLFRRDGYRVLCAESGAAALELLAVNPVDVIVSDQRMPGMTGVDFLRRTKVLHPDTVRITLSGYTDLQSIIDAVNEGAVYKFLTKPWDDERLRDHVAQAFALKEMADENRRLQAELAAASAAQGVLNGRLEQMLQRQREQARKVQRSSGNLRDLIEILPAAVYGLDPEGLLVLVNEQGLKVLPEAAGWLGALPGPALGALLQPLRLRPAAEQGCAVQIGARRHRAWLCRMPPGEFERGEVLLLQDEHG